MRFIYGFLGTVIGILLIKYTFPLVNMMGRISWAERYLGSGFGGTYALYKIIGVLLIMASLMHTFGVLDLLVSPFSGIFGGLDK